MEELAHGEEQLTHVGGLATYRAIGLSVTLPSLPLTGSARRAPLTLRGRGEILIN